MLNRNRIARQWLRVSYCRDACYNCVSAISRRYGRLCVAFSGGHGGGVAEGFLTRLTGSREERAQELRAESERLRRELRDTLGADIARLEAQQERLAKTVLALQESLTAATARQQKAERRAAQFILAFQLN